MNLNDTFNRISTIIYTDDRVQGTGFFFHEFGRTDKNGPHWAKIERVWLVTNRHVVMPKGKTGERRPRKIVFHIRKIFDGKLMWEPIILTDHDINQRVRLHPDSSIDVSVINILDLITARLKSQDEKVKYLPWYAPNKNNFPGKNNIDVDVSDDILVIGYPRNFYDNENLYPIVKSGIIASRWGANFQGKRHFLIDANLLPGSSGSIVISKPVNIVVKGESILQSSEKQFALLGVYSAQKYLLENSIDFDEMVITRKTNFNLGIVWYADIIEEIIQIGIPVSSVHQT